MPNAINITINQDGAVSSETPASGNLTVTKGDIQVTLHVTATGKNNSDYFATVHFTRPDSKNAGNLVMAAGSESNQFEYVFDQSWFFAVAGVASLSIVLTGMDGTVAATTSYTFNIQDSDVDTDAAANLTYDQYEALLVYFARCAKKDTGNTFSGQNIFEQTILIENGIKGADDDEIHFLKGTGNNVTRFNLPNRSDLGEHTLADTEQIEGLQDQIDDYAIVYKSESYSGTASYSTSFERNVQKKLAGDGGIKQLTLSIGTETATPGFMGTITYETGSGVRPDPVTFTVAEGVPFKLVQAGISRDYFRPNVNAVITFLCWYDGFFVYVNVVEVLKD